MTDNYYALKLWDPATPGFCSFSKVYIGTEEELKTVVARMKKAEEYEDTQEAILDYFRGNHAATHNIAYQVIPVLEPVHYKSEMKTQVGETIKEHFNCWECPYMMKYDSGLIHQIVIKYDGKYHRCVRAWLKNLCYESTVGEWNMLSSKFWGHGFLLDITGNKEKDFTFNNLLYVVEESYDKLSDAIDSLGKTDLFNFKAIYDEVFADG